MAVLSVSAPKRKAQGLTKAASCRRTPKMKLSAPEGERDRVRGLLDQPSAEFPPRVLRTAIEKLKNLLDRFPEYS